MLVSSTFFRKKLEEIVSSGRKKPRKKPGINCPPEETANPDMYTWPSRMLADQDGA